MQAAQTIRRNTQAFEAAVLRATNVKGFSLDSYFDAFAVPAGVVWEQAARHQKAKLIKRGDNYTLRIHSNLWYEFN